jgi:hypothetical protein
MADIGSALPYQEDILPFHLGTFAKFRKTTISFVTSFCLSGRVAPTGRIFVKFDISVFLVNISRKFKFIQILQE